jgi:hypothetical protein
MANGNRHATPMRFASRLRQIAPAIILLTCLSSALANNPIPTVVGPVVPQAVVPGSGAFTLKVYGANFVSGAVVNWNRSPRSTTFISARELQAQILASDVATATAGYITVTNPPPGGGVSSASYAIVEVHSPTDTIVATKPHSYLPDNPPDFLVMTDFNNDGTLDFAASYGSEIKVLLGTGSGTFRHSSTAAYGYFGTGPAAIASGDFNNDGNEDLVFGANPNGPPTRLQLNLGNGDGTFRKGLQFGHFENIWPLNIVVGDFNGDGNLDLIASANELYVFLGNGHGTFRPPLLDDVSAYDVVSADFNGDGILDLAILGETEIKILLGKGDGTFKTRTIAIPKDFSCGFGPGLLVSDFNNDGKADLAYCEGDQTNGKIWVMLGNGDGTFKKPLFIPIDSGIYGFSFAAGDFNSDGKTDLIVNYFVSNSQTETDLYLGKGDGRFQGKEIIELPGAPDYNGEEGIVSADFNSDGLLDFIFQQPGDIAVFLQK